MMGCQSCVTLRARAESAERDLSALREAARGLSDTLQVGPQIRIFGSVGRALEILRALLPPATGPGGGHE